MFDLFEKSDLQYMWELWTAISLHKLCCLPKHCDFFSNSMVISLFTLHWPLQNHVVLRFEAQSLSMTLTVFDWACSATSLLINGPSIIHRLFLSYQHHFYHDPHCYTASVAPSDILNLFALTFETNMSYLSATDGGWDFTADKAQSVHQSEAAQNELTILSLELNRWMQEILVQI
jgi:hypothetical protein